MYLVCNWLCTQMLDRQTLPVWDSDASPFVITNIKHRSAQGEIHLGSAQLSTITVITLINVEARPCFVPCVISLLCIQVAIGDQEWLTHQLAGCAWWKVDKRKVFLEIPECLTVKLTCMKFITFESCTHAGRRCRTMSDTDCGRWTSPMTFHCYFAPHDDLEQNLTCMCVWFCDDKESSPL